ncbi:ornithine cyclodeaminase family protein [Ruegeria sp. HKCCD8929]|uniref:ornithine cyclodeaminase family protein n=1 Tax=Ruegeria sp. HKCCD8929 TaxID=2683006 RepID=UPI0014880D48|nr:ornithine cyclodeaminase family protein [Ruegeria sp. HKCCD8929]
MDLKILNSTCVRDLLPMGECIDVVEKAMISASQKRAIMPLRSKMELAPNDGLLAFMPGAMLDDNIFGAKLIGVFDKNFAHGLESHNGVVVLFEGEHGRPFLVADAGQITAIRTAAASAVATRHLARADAKVLAIFGYGTQARKHAEAMCCVRTIEKVKIWGRSLQKAEAFADDLRQSGIAAEACETAQTAASGADIICTTTASPIPILLGDWLEPGQHVNAVGTSFPGARELDTWAVARSRFFVDLREGAIKQAGEFQLARDDGVIDESHILGEIGEVADQTIAGRNDDHEITVYKSLGLIVQDLACAHHIHRKSQTKNLGTVISAWSP